MLQHKVAISGFWWLNRIILWSRSKPADYVLNAFFSFDIESSFIKDTYMNGMVSLAFVICLDCSSQSETPNFGAELSEVSCLPLSNVSLYNNIFTTAI